MRAVHKPFAVLLAGLLMAAPGHAADDDQKKPVRPPTKQTQVIRQETFKTMEEVQKLIEAKDLAGALRGLDAIKAGIDKLNDFEKATLWNLYAAVYYEQDNYAQAIDAYLNLLRQQNLPDGLRNGAMYALAQLYMITEAYDKATALLKKWMEITGGAQPDAHALLAQAHYLQKRYPQAEQSLLEALRLGRDQQVPPKESWLALLRAVYYEMNEYEKSAKVLEVLVARFPKPTYFLQLSGMYGLLDRQKDQLKVLHAAYQADFLKSQSELINLARLYMVQEAPWPAVELMRRGFQEKTIEETPDTLQTYAQALALAKEYEAQIPVLEKLAETTGEATHYVYLGQALAELGRWSEAEQAFRSALGGKKLQDANSVRMQRGTALFYLDRLHEAREVFEVVAQSKEDAEAAGNWIQFLTAEIQRKQALAAIAGGNASTASDEDSGPEG